MNTLRSTDQLGNSIEFNFPPKRIISLVPSQTELLFDLGLQEEIVGITKFCIHPAELVKQKPKIGGTKRFNIELIKSLNPELIIGNKEENYRAGIETLQQHFPVWMSDIDDLEGAYAMMHEISRITNRLKEGEDLITSIRNSFQDYVPGNSLEISITVAYFIWRKPYMVAGSNTFIDYMLGLLGVKNVFTHVPRYPEIEPALLGTSKPDFIFLSSEPYSFGEKHIEEFQALSPGSKVMLVDGEMFSWYGSRLKLVPHYFKELKTKMAGNKG
jgi:ABC-type Fe3+-hydroxamate transport system substrate-binding protein